jgi:hypothetical protein
VAYAAGAERPLKRYYNYYTIARKHATCKLQVKLETAATTKILQAATNAITTARKLASCN